MIAEAWWHGCWLKPGHHLFTREGRHVLSNDASFPLVGMTGLDGCYAPRRHRYSGNICFTYQCGGFKASRDALFHASDELPQGQFLRHVFERREATMLAWWDRTQGDRRGNCNSCFVVRGVHSTQGMLEAFPRLFPLQARCLERGAPEEADQGFELAEVFVTPTPVFTLSCPACTRRLYETRYPKDQTFEVPRHPPWPPGAPGDDGHCSGSGVRVPWRSQDTP